MPTVPQPYQYPLADIPGTETSLDHLIALIAINIPSGVNPVINNDGTNLIVQFDQDLEDTDKAILDTLVPRTNEYFIITSDGGVTDLGNPATVSKPVGNLSATTITLQCKNGDGTNSNGFGQTINIGIDCLVPVDKSSCSFDGNGRCSFTIGVSMTMRGKVVFTLTTNDQLPAHDADGNAGPGVLNGVWT